MAKSVQETVARWQAGASGAQQRYTDGVQSTQIDVMGRAKAAGAIAAQRFAEAVSSGRYAAGIDASGGTQGWKAAVAKKSANYGTGIAAGSDKFSRSMSKLLPALDSIVAGLPARVPGDAQGNVMRRVAPIAVALSQNKGQFKG